MPVVIRCPNCGAAIPDCVAPGLCPQCAFQGALELGEEEAVSSASVPAEGERIGRYKLPAGRREDSGDHGEHGSAWPDRTVGLAAVGGAVQVRDRLQTALMKKSAPVLISHWGKCSADFQSAVSRVYNPQAPRLAEHLADCKSAIQQSATLRYKQSPAPRRIRFGEKCRLVLFCFSFLAGVNLLAEPGRIVLFNGTFSAGKSSLAEVVVRDSKTKYEVVSFDDFHRSQREKHGTRFNREQYEDFRISLYRHAKAQSEAGRNIIIDTVEFDLAYDRYCEILDCPRVIKAIVYCPLEHLLKRIDRRNSADDPAGRRPVLLAFQQFLQMYKPQTSAKELVVEKTNTSRIRAALVEAGKKAGNPKQYEALYKEYVKVFGIDKDREITVVLKGKYDLVLDTKARSKKENVRILEDYMKGRR